MDISCLEASASLSMDKLAYWLALWRTPGVGPIRFMQLLDIFPAVEDIFAASVSQLSALGLPVTVVNALQKPDWAAVEQDMRWSEQVDNHIVSYHDARYPPLLKHIVSAPAVLFVQGSVVALHSYQLAIIGSRNPSPAGKDNAQQFACQLSQAGLTITSGLALGIDGIAHRSALACQGQTVAVLGAGLDCIYPRSHQQLAQAVAGQGALVSEYPLGVPPKAAHFPQRNRLVCGLSLGVLVVEATRRSGSLITARLAAEQGREVFSIPGSIHNPLAQGCHFLIRQGAKLVETAQDIIEELGALAAVCSPDVLFPSTQKQVSADRPLAGMDKTCEAVLDCMGFEITSVDQMVVRTGLAPKVVASIVSLLELKGSVMNAPGGYSRIVNTH